MIKKTVRFILTLVGAGIGLGLCALAYELLKTFEIADLQSVLQPYANILIFAGSAVLFALILFAVSSGIIKVFMRFVNWVESKLQKIPMVDMLAGSIGLIIGFIIAFLLSGIVEQVKIQWLSITISAVLYLILGFLGMRLAVSRKHEASLSGLMRRRDKGRIKTSEMASPKLIDTSVIIDGRIYDICKTGLVEGTLIIPGFVLNELRHIADSSDPLKRNRGRRGLDILNKIQKELDMPVKIMDIRYDEELDVDSKLLKMADELKAKIITNDYNLKKVATVQGVSILSVNELADALKAVVLPGEEMTVQIVKEGKESGQGVAYLDDGTMIVVEGGKKCVGRDEEVLVTSVLQTAAGRMIFAKMKEQA
ncbi:MAG: PIN/TRAM domain-containing protein [Bacillota bacterium]|nr:PIN/TRAM domain-containing protein [Bacillota bacterium]